MRWKWFLSWIVRQRSSFPSKMLYRTKKKDLFIENRTHQQLYCSQVYCGWLLYLLMYGKRWIFEMTQSAEVASWWSTWKIGTAEVMQDLLPICSSPIEQIYLHHRRQVFIISMVFVFLCFAFEFVHLVRHSYSLSWTSLEGNYLKSGKYNRSPRRIVNPLCDCSIAYIWLIWNVFFWVEGHRKNNYAPPTIHDLLHRISQREVAAMNYSIKRISFRQQYENSSSRNKGLISLNETVKTNVSRWMASYFQHIEKPMRQYQVYHRLF